MELIEEVLSKENLNKAYLQVFRNKGSAGVDGVSVNELKEYLQVHGDKLIEDILKRKYKPMPVKRVEIPKDNGKIRKLGIPTVVDRVIQQAIAQILSPIYEKQFSEFSYGFRPKRSCEMAIIKSLEFINDRHDWVVDIDLERFFDTVNHDRLISLMYKTIKDTDLMSLINKYLKSGVMDQGNYEETNLGTPQGGNLSPLLSNIMLNELDKELTSRGLRFVRYADDCNIYVKSEKAANRVMKSITTFIEKKLGLIVNASKSKVGRPRDIKFLGFGYYFDIRSKRYEVIPHQISIQKFKRKLKRLTKRSWSISLDKRLLKLKQLIRGWVNYFRIAKMKTVLAKIDSKVRNAIRVIIWKQWKVSDRRIKSLVKLGIDIEQAKGITWCRRGYQYVSHSWIIQRTISNIRLEKRGLVSTRDHYLKIHIVI
jgi:group II intron reverse transcriptase/maturase